MYHLLLVLVCLGGLVSSTTQKERVLSLISADYDVNEWPSAAEDAPTNVSVQMYFNSFGSLSAADMDFTIDTFIRQRWYDKRLAYEGGLESYTIMDPELQKKIWKPDTYFENVKAADVHDVTMPNVLLRVHRSGLVLYSMRVTLRMSCNLELELYPFDAQICYVRISSYANTDDVIRYHWLEGGTALVIHHSIQISQFDLLGYGTRVHKNVYVTGNFSGLTATFSLRRQNGYHLLQTYIPTMLMVSISWVSFWLDPNAAPGRITLGVTTLLTLTTLSSGIRQNLPPVSYVKAIDVWIGFCMIMIFGALLEFTLVNWLANKKMPEDSKIPRLIKLPKCLAGQVEEPEEEEEDEEAPKTKLPGAGDTYMFYARALDRLARILFPLVFFIFNLIYWPYYIAHQRAIA